MKLNKKQAVTNAADLIPEGTHITRLVQLAHVGYQPAYEENDPPKDSLTAIFQTADGKQIAKTMPVSFHPSSNCYALLGHLEEDDAGDIEPSSAVGGSYAIDVSLRAGKWSRVDSLAPLEPFQDPIPEVEGCLWFDCDDMPDHAAAAKLSLKERQALNTTFMKLHKEIRQKLQSRVQGGGDDE